MDVGKYSFHLVPALLVEEVGEIDVAPDHAVGEGSEGWFVVRQTLGKKSLVASVISCPPR